MTWKVIERRPRTGEANPDMEHLPIIRPTLPDLAEVQRVLAESWSSGVVTVGATVRAFEEEARRRTGAKHAIGLSCCTSGLMLAPRALGLPAGSEVIVPSFTFAATAQALLWNGLVPVFVDCLPGTCTIDPEDVERNITDRTSAICPVYIYGLPPDVDALVEIGRRRNIPVYFDSAQGLGASYKGQPAGRFGRLEVFSMSPTKVVTAVEGGLVTTDDDEIAAKIRSMRDYGKDPDNVEDMINLGLSTRMSELHGAVALLSLRNMDALVRARLSRIARYRERLATLPGCRVQEYPADRTTSGNYFVLFIGEGARRSRDEVYKGLEEAGIQTKRYFFPPVHEQTVFQRWPMRLSRTLSETKRAAAAGLALPLYSHMTEDQMERVCGDVERLLG
jgi:dTDP-4-amino-4,6-dideoxygalactose transaminase